MTIPEDANNFEFTFETSDEIQFAWRNPRTWQCVAGTAIGCDNDVDGVDVDVTVGNNMTEVYVSIPLVEHSYQLYLLSLSGGRATISYSWGCSEIISSCQSCDDYICANGATPACDGSDIVLCTVITPSE